MAENIENLGITLDIGHAYLMKRQTESKSPENEIADEVRMHLGDFLTHLHIHDNKGIRDDHLVPLDGDINFKPIIQALKDINYSNKIIIESWQPEMSQQTGKRGLEVVKRLFES